MLIHHFYPKTRNIGDHFVQRGVERMIREAVPGASFRTFDVNRRGSEETYGLTRATVERANREADLVVVGGSNLYEGSWRWPWGVHLEPDALAHLRVPLFLLGVGTGSAFLSPTHRPSARAQREIGLLNERADLSGARDVLTLRWLRALGVSKAELTGDPATFIFNRPAQLAGRRVLIAMPPRRFWSSRGQFLKVRLHGRAMFRALVSLARSLAQQGRELLVACNDPADLGLARRLFGERFDASIVCPENPEEYFGLLAEARAVVAGRLHTAVVAFSLGVPFVLVDADRRTRGFVETYGLDEWAATPSRAGFRERLDELTGRLLADDALAPWQQLVRERDLMRERGMGLLRGALARVN
jgi:polysaccharide pyruvyl transferase WcaK-like protein